MRNARSLLLLTLTLFFSKLYAAETIYGYLEKTLKPGACAQITDALNETYYIFQDPNATTRCSALIGKRVIVKGNVETAKTDGTYFMKLEDIEEDLKQRPPNK